MTFKKKTPVFKISSGISFQLFPVVCQCFSKLDFFLDNGGEGTSLRAYGVTTLEDESLSSRTEDFTAQSLFFDSSLLPVTVLDSELYK